MKLIKNTWKHKTLFLMALPAVLLLIAFNYVPMAGLVVAFKKFNYADGIFKSPWNGLENFRYLFMVGDTAWRLTRNTIGYYLLFTFFGTIGNVAIAIGINEMIHKRTAKYFQTCMILPTFISYIAITFIVKAFLQSDIGIINRFRLITPEQLAAAARGVERQQASRAYKEGKRTISQQMQDAAKQAEADRGQSAPKKNAPDRGER